MNKNLLNFCNSFPDSWWLTKFLRDYGPPNPRKPLYLTWKQFYFYYTTNRLRSVTVNIKYNKNLHQFNIWLSPHMTYFNLLTELNRIYNSFISTYNSWRKINIYEITLESPHEIVIIPHHNTWKLTSRSTNHFPNLIDMIDYHNLKNIQIKLGY